MTVSTSTNKAGPYAGAGLPGPFTVPFRFLSAAHLQVIKTSTAGLDTVLTLTTDYTVAGVGAATGSVTLTAPLEAGERLTIIRDVPFVQLADYVNNDAFPAESHEDALDLLTMQGQQLKERVDAALTLPATAFGANTDLPSPQSNRLIGWNEAANGLQNYDATTLATIVAFGTSRADTFTGNGTQTQFALTANPGALANLDVAVGGVTRTPGVDYTFSGTTLTFISGAPALGAQILARYFLALPQGATDSAAAAFLQAGTLNTRSVQSKLREWVSVQDFGADPTGSADSTSAIAAALTASNFVYFPQGDYRITSTLTFNTAITKKLRGDNARILCRGVIGPSFAFNCANNTFSDLVIDGLEFNGSLNGDNNWATASTTWTGLLSNTTAATVSGHLVSRLQLTNCIVRFSNSTNGIALDLRGVFWAKFENSRLAYFPYGHAALAGVANNVTTTISFNKCYMHYNRQCVEFGTNVTDVQFYDCVFESSVVAAALFKTKALFEGCYFENIGYSLDAAVTTGKTIKGFGLSFGAGILDTAVISAINIMYAEVNFNSCQFQYRNTTYASVTRPNAKYLLMVGRGSGSGAGGCARFVGCLVSNFNSTAFLESDANAASNYTDDNGCSFEWHQGSREYYLPYGDVRSIRYGSVYIEFPSTGSNPQYAMQAEVKRGLLVVPNSSFTTPVNSPVGGQWLRGDVIYSATPSAGGSIGSVCTASGTPGTWKTFGAISL